MCKRVWLYIFFFIYHLGNCDDQCNANKLTVHSTCYLLQKESWFNDYRKKWSTLAGIIWSRAVNFCPQYNPQPSFSGPKDQVCISFVINIWNPDSRKKFFDWFARFQTTKHLTQGSWTEFALKNSPLAQNQN